MSVPGESYVLELMNLVKYVTHTKNRGLVLVPKDLWSTGYSFKIHGRSDFNYATNSDDRRSILGNRVFVNSTPICF